MKTIYKIELFFIDIAYKILHGIRIGIHKTIEWCDEYCKAWKPKNTADDESMVKVVRCKDCKNAVLWVDNENYHCLKEIGYDTGVHERDWFCADGERKQLYRSIEK